MLLTLPTAATSGKYVWNETIHLTLLVETPDQTVQSIQVDRAPAATTPEDWICNLTGMACHVQPFGMVLSAAPGYAMPEAITVWVGDTAYVVSTTGEAASGDVSFDPGTGLLTVSEPLWALGITVEAAAIPLEEAEE